MIDYLQFWKNRKKMIFHQIHITATWCEEDGTGWDGEDTFPGSTLFIPRGLSKLDLDKDELAMFPC